MSEPPIFLVPMGRTGGSLFITILDAHPQIAMSYEIFQDRLLDVAGKPVETAWAISALRRAADGDENRWIKGIPEKNFKTFVARAHRAGVEVRELLEELESFHKEGGTFDNITGRLDFIDRLMIFKMRKFGKQYWGGKAATVNPRELYRRHPQACFFIMIRDGRDVLASQLNVGNFQTSAEECAQQWRNHILDFRDFRRECQARTMEIHYETLVEDPQSVLRNVCEFIGVDYDPAMLMYHKQDLTLFRNPHGHLSHKQISLGLNKNSIGRWKRDLSTEDTGIFEAINSDLLAESGYLDSNNH